MQVAPPGAAWSYNNAGFSIAGRVIEAVTGTSINAAIRDLVFQPLGLEHAGTTAGDFIVQRFAAGHIDRATASRRCSARSRRRRASPPAASASASTDLLTYARFHLGDGTRGERRARAEARVARADAHARSCASRAPTTTSASRGICERSASIRTAAHGGTLGGHILLLELVPERNFAIAHPHQREHRLAADPGRRARGAEVVPRRDIRDEPGDRASRAGGDAAVGRAAREASRIPRRTSGATCVRPTSSWSAPTTTG